MTKKIDEITAIVEDWHQRNFNHVTKGTPRWHEMQAAKADLIKSLAGKPEKAAEVAPVTDDK